MVNDLAGHWQGLNTDGQLPRYRAIAEIITPGSSVLDVGAGEAVLFGHLNGCSYLGLEPSALACRNALETGAEVLNVSAEQFLVSAAGMRRFDCIVFNEMLYYARNPVGLLESYANSLLATGGQIICSIYQRPCCFSLRGWFLRLTDRRRPMSNLHCEQMLRAFMHRQDWKLECDLNVPPWHIWSARV